MVMSDETLLAHALDLSRRGHDRADEAAYWKQKREAETVRIDVTAYGRTPYSAKPGAGAPPSDRATVVRPRSCKIA
jgi:hypothetical protein